MTILLVDDETSVIEVLADFLTECGYSVHTASNGVEALERLDTLGEVDLIVSDIRMPKMDGIEFLRLARLRFPETPMIMMTAHGDEAVAVDVFHDGAFDYIRKPVGLEALTERIEVLRREKAEEDRALEDYSILLDGSSETGNDVILPEQVSEIQDQVRQIETLVRKRASAETFAMAEIDESFAKVGRLLTDLRLRLSTSRPDGNQNPQGV